MVKAVLLLKSEQIGKGTPSRRQNGKTPSLPGQAEGFTARRSRRGSSAGGVAAIALPRVAARGDCSAARGCGVRAGVNMRG